MLPFVILGLAGCALALAALALDWRGLRREARVTGWRYTTTVPLEQSNSRPTE